MFWPAPPVAPTEWQAEQLRSLKIGPRPSACVSVASKFAFAAAKAVAFVPGSASPKDSAPIEVEVVVVRFVAQATDRADSNGRTQRHETHPTHLSCHHEPPLWVAPEVWGHEEVERSDRGQAEKHPAGALSAARRRRIAHTTSQIAAAGTQSAIINR